jgi:hypothetical protein
MLQGQEREAQIQNGAPDEQRWEEEQKVEE